jgi:hypothetical protein
MRAEGLVEHLRCRDEGPAAPAAPAAPKFLNGQAGLRVSSDAAAPDVPDDSTAAVAAAARAPSDAGV